MPYISPLPEPAVHAVPLGHREALVYHWPARLPGRGAILFSHGMASAPWKYAAIIGHWLDHGFDVWAPWHVDSRDHPRNADFPGLAAWAARIEDMRAASALMATPFVAAGHSFGALTALVMGGAEGDRPAGIAGALRDPLATCVIALSPPPPIPGLISRDGYAAIAVPALIQTGDRDVFPGDPETPDAWRVHLPAYEAAPEGGSRYLLLLDGVDHYFGSAICELEREEAPQSDLLDATIAIADLFIAAHYPAADPAARAALDARLTDDGPVRLATR